MVGVGGGGGGGGVMVPRLRPDHAKGTPAIAHHSPLLVTQVPELLRDVVQGSEEAMSTMVIFDGEKRFEAYPTFNKV